MIVLTAVGILPKWLKRREAVESEPVAKDSAPIQSFAGISTDDPALQDATKTLVIRLMNYAHTNKKLTNIKIEQAPGLRVWTPEPNHVEVIMPFSGTEGVAHQNFRMRARARYVAEPPEMKVISIAIHRLDMRGQEVGLADPIIYF